MQKQRQTAATIPTTEQGRAERRQKPIRYPESDGKPMGESELHRDELWRLIQILKAAFAGQPEIYVSGNLILYYEEGNPRASVSPDVFVVKGVAKHRRLIYKLWEEQVSPCFVIEITSSSTRRTDETKKRALYARLGVREYVLYDPRFPGLESRKAPLEGYRLGPAGFEPVAADADGALMSEELGLLLGLRDGRLEFIEPRSGRTLLSVEERADLEAERADAATEAMRAAEARVAYLEALLRERRSPEDPPYA